MKDQSNGVLDRQYYYIPELVNIITYLITWYVFFIYKRFNECVIYTVKPLYNGIAWDRQVFPL